ncbi:hypothetical protein N0V94_005989 [Neodidymelliopsis sp. IMI 364377]|nr:hypothetical protein N0V94_005989 [Neodidymelliopsis sp. IMI 364377]
MSQSSGLLAYSVRDDQSIFCRIWNMTTGTCLQTLELNRDGAILDMTFSQDSTKLSTFAISSGIKIWDVQSGALLTVTADMPIYFNTTSLVFSQDLNMLADYSPSGKISIWDIPSQACLQTIVTPARDHLSLAFSPKSNLLALAADYDGKIEILDARNGECRYVIRTQNELASLSFDDTGLYLSTKFGDVDLSFLRETQPTPNENRPVMPVYRAAGLSPDTNWLMYRDRRVLWLPPDYRPSEGNIAVSGDTVAFASGDGRVWVAHFIPEELSS